MARKAAALLETAAELEETARAALAEDQSEISDAALAKAEKQIRAAEQARDAALEKQALTAQQLVNQTELLKQVDHLTIQHGEKDKHLAANAETIDALQAELATLRDHRAEAAKEAARSAAAAEAAEDKIASRVSQTLQAAETCVTTAERVTTSSSNSRRGNSRKNRA